MCVIRIVDKRKCLRERARASVLFYVSRVSKLLGLLVDEVVIPDDGYVGALATGQDSGFLRCQNDGRVDKNSVRVASQALELNGAVCPRSLFSRRWCCGRISQRLVIGH